MSDEPPFALGSGQGGASVRDIDLVAGILRGETLALLALMQRYNRHVYRAARGVSGRQGADDVVQQTWIRGNFSTATGPPSRRCWQGGGIERRSGVQRHDVNICTTRT